MIDTKPLICKQYNTDDYIWKKQGEKGWKYKVHKAVSKDDIIDLSLRWHFITGRLERFNSGKANFNQSYIDKLQKELLEIRGYLGLDKELPDSEITYKYIQSNVKPFVTLLEIDDAEMGLPALNTIDYADFRKNYYY